MHSQLFISYWDKNLLFLDVDVVPIVVDEGGTEPLDSDLLLVGPGHDGRFAFYIFIVDEKVRCLF